MEIKVSAIPILNHQTLILIPYVSNILLSIYI
jgi:hypothetical protein